MRHRRSISALAAAVFAAVVTVAITAPGGPAGASHPAHAGQPVHAARTPIAGTDPTGLTGPYRVGNSLTGYAALAVHPGGSPPGVNVWACRPGAAHPRPVILLPGTLWTVQDSFAALGPILANAGYCVFGLDYGTTELTRLTGGRSAADGDIATSAAELATFVDRVLATTQAAQVDIVGWSQGGMMPRWYLRFLGGAAKVHRLIGLAPSNHGTTLDGLFRLVSETRLVLGQPLLSLIGCPACTEQQNTSPFIAALNAGGDTVAGVRYTVIESKLDEVVTPYASAFLSGPDVENITVQNACPLDLSDHLAMPYDSAVVQYVRNALGPDDASFRPVCDPSLPVAGSVTYH
ncbi:MAG TPA: alpha/beta fold hydrolase [Jatrophihabitantaceae bacterium]